MIRIHSPWHKTSDFEWRRAGENWQKIILPPIINSFQFQIAEVVHCLDKGQIGVKYSGESGDE
ncbi:hypothetical protein [Arachidicoccus soli]|uniref:Uncharacterized protein n=1 Tax=Arachidicoccus soli TaxID=2341117 RepID=A0A386HN39_9BACT|nr:hypothetical protein [Arachidicoccus soli]AYD47317.1 hypothetical protein D6B99_06650 [Arachidicoccus soli]